MTISSAASEQDASTVNCGTWNGTVPRANTPLIATLTAIREERVNQRAQQERDADSALEGGRNEFYSGPDAKTKAIGAWNVVRGAFLKTATRASSAFNSATDAVAVKVTDMGFRRRFGGPNAPEDERLLASYSAQVVHNGIPITGTLYVTDKRICFHNGDAIHTVVSFGDVVSICECVAVNTYDARLYLIQKPDDSVVTNAMQVYATERRLIEFVNIAPNLTDAAMEIGNTRVRSRDAAAMCYAAAYEVWTALVPSREVPGITYSAL